MYPRLVGFFAGYYLIGGICMVAHEYTGHHVFQARIPVFFGMKHKPFFLI
jgi:hypothetical protein